MTRFNKIFEGVFEPASAEEVKERSKDAAKIDKKIFEDKYGELEIGDIIEITYYGVDKTRIEKYEVRCYYGRFDRFNNIFIIFFHII